MFAIEGNCRYSHLTGIVSLHRAARRKWPKAVSCFMHGIVPICRWMAIRKLKSRDTECRPLQAGRIAEPLRPQPWSDGTSLFCVF